MLLTSLIEEPDCRQIPVSQYLPADVALATNCNQVHPVTAENQHLHAAVLETSLAVHLSINNTDLIILLHHK